MWGLFVVSCILLCAPSLSSTDKVPLSIFAPVVAPRHSKILVLHPEQSAQKNCSTPYTTGPAIISMERLGAIHVFVNGRLNRSFNLERFPMSFLHIIGELRHPSPYPLSGLFTNRKRSQDIEKRRHIVESPKKVTFNQNISIMMVCMRCRWRVRVYPVLRFVLSEGDLPRYFKDGVKL